VTLRFQALHWRRRALRYRQVGALTNISDARSAIDASEPSPP